LSSFARVFPIGQPRALLYQGWYDWLEGRRALAGRKWRGSLSIAHKLGMPYDEGLAHYEIGRHATGAERQTHLARACEIFAQLDAAYDLARAQGLT
jgi:hypothetical protein